MEGIKRMEWKGSRGWNGGDQEGGMEEIKRVEWSRSRGWNGRDQEGGMEGIKTRDVLDQSCVIFCVVV